MTRASVFVLTLLAAACAGDAIPVASTGGELVRKADYSGQRYYDPGLSARPLTPAEVTDFTFAAPVRVEFYDDFAVAWRSVDGETSYGHENALAAWRVLASVPANITPTSGDVRPTDEPAAPTTASPVASPTPTDVDGRRADVDVGRGDVRSELVFGTLEQALPFVIIDWNVDDLEAWWGIAPVAHPGCL